jgi:signal transduction histidine kinase
MPRLATFIRENTEEILKEWEKFARTLPMGANMDVVALRDHAREMLDVIAGDLATTQTRRQQLDKSHGKTDARQRDTTTAAQHHGAGRAESGFTLGQMVAEFRALRATVIRLWTTHGFVAAATDLEDMIRFNEAIDQAIAESITRYTSDIGHSKERFLAILGHDLRTPLSSILTSSRFMLDTGEFAEPHLTLVKQIANASRRMNQMVLDLLDFTRTRFGDSIPIVRQDVDARKIVHDVVAEIAPSHPENPVHIETGGDLRGSWDPERLSQALANLLGNAVQHGAKGSPIKVTARGTDNDVAIAVHNEGPPIPKNATRNLFQPMKRMRPDGPNHKSHLGLGLFIVDKIVSAHGGTVDVKSTREQGTTFTVHLPRQAR